MNFSRPKSFRFVPEFLLPCIVALAFSAAPARGQDSGGDNNGPRGNRGEISITVRDSSGEPLPIAAAVKLYHDGMPAGQGTTSHGRAFFITQGLGNFTVNVEANGYKPAQKEISMPIAIRAEVDVMLERASGNNANVSSKPVLAPKAKEAFDKALQAMNANKLDEAEKYVNEAVRLAPGHPDVLFVQGVLYLTKHNWPQAEEALGKATQVDPGNGRAFAALGMALNNQSKYAESIPAFEKAVELDPPGSYETQWALGKAYYYHEQYKEALKASELALTESAGKAPQIELLVAQSLTAIGRYEDSAQTLRGFIRDHGDRPEAATAKRWLDNLSKSGKIH